MAVGASRYETGQQVLYTSNRPGEGSVLVIVSSVSTNVALGEEPMIAVRMVRNDDYTPYPFLSFLFSLYARSLTFATCLDLHHHTLVAGWHRARYSS